ncbi:hypothetical protein [Piscinibacter koreensis]|uniref:Uncharacterized protein n=1 Tax=Piscinibacter koreensis TaxID=2742824 RepID=A0A7Y6TYV5_9BURK|nr:hypothetical protein [Schlegelella koreensis]NUZ08466.1 hypothetical protein [Schlegelella koreensis]
MNTASLGGLVGASRPWLRSRWTWVSIAAFASASALIWSWPWLSAIGAASVIVSLLPCAVMCGLGLCMSPRRGGSCHTGKGADGVNADVVPATVPKER